MDGVGTKVPRGAVAARHTWARRPQHTCRHTTRNALSSPSHTVTNHVHRYIRLHTTRNALLLQHSQQPCTLALTLLHTRSGHRSTVTCSSCQATPPSTPRSSPTCMTASSSERPACCGVRRSSPPSSYLTVLDDGDARVRGHARAVVSWVRLRRCVTHSVCGGVSKRRALHSTRAAAHSLCSPEVLSASWLRGHGG